MSQDVIIPRLSKAEYERLSQPEEGLGTGMELEMLLGGFAGKLGDKLQHSSVVNALANKAVGFNQRRKFGKTKPTVKYTNKSHGSYDRSTNTIKLPKRDKGTLLSDMTKKHEMQHWKDTLRGKSTGFNPELGNKAYRANKGEYDANMAAMNLANRSNKNMYNFGNKSDMYNNRRMHEFYGQFDNKVLPTNNYNIGLYDTLNRVPKVNTMNPIGFGSGLYIGSEL